LTGGDGGFLEVLFERGLLFPFLEEVSEILRELGEEGFSGVELPFPPAGKFCKELLRVCS
jgi:hypothetical protein